jgi:hypothetical protein
MYARQKKLHTNPDAQNNIKGVQSGVMGVPLIYTIIFLYYRSLSYYGCKLQWDPQQHHLAKKLHYMAINDTRLSVGTRLSVDTWLCIATRLSVGTRLKVDTRLSI